MPAGTLTARIVGFFALIGLGLGGAVLLFLWATGYFKPVQDEGFDSLGRAFAGGIAFTAVLVFALLVGIVLSALAGVYSALNAQSSAAAVLVGLVASAVGYVALIATLGLFLLSGVNGLSPQPVPTPVATPRPTQSAEELATCEELFGQGSIACREEASTEEPGQEQQETSVRDLTRLGLGVLPAALVGALSASLFAPRRIEHIEGHQNVVGSGT